jgi:crotonobetaine/carnitine-CoA ligase
MGNDDPLPDLTIAGLLMAVAEQTPARDYVRIDRRTVGVGEIAGWAQDHAVSLGGVGIRPGDRVATMLGNGVNHLALFLGIALAGAVWVPINPEARGPGLAHVLSVVDPVRIYATDTAAEYLIAAGLDPKACPIVRTDGWGIPDRRPPGHLPTSAVQAAGGRSVDTRCIIFTSGTSGPPKGVIVSDRMLIAAATATAMASDCEPGDVYLLWEPLHHIGGVQAAVMALLRPVVLVAVQRFSASGLWPTVRAHGVTKLHYLGGILDILLEAPPTPEDKQHPVRLAFGGGCRTDARLAFERRFAIPVREVYGMTEASSFTTINHDGVVGSVGRPVPWFEVELVGTDGASVGDGQAGEIVVVPKCPGLLTAGYLGDIEATSRLLANGRLHTGDLGRRDRDGNLFFLGRMTDSLRRRGENVSAWEVETALADHPHIAEAAVVGVPAAIGEHDIMAFVLLRDGAPFDPAGLAHWSATALAPHHVPRYWKSVTAFPRTPSQRIRKDQLDKTTAGAWDSQR